MSQKPLSLTTAFLLIFIAALTDGLQVLTGLLIIIPFGGPVLAFVSGLIITIFASLLFGFWFSLLGISLFNKHPLAFIITLALEYTPGIGLIPSWTVFVVRTLYAEHRASRAV